MDWNQEEDGWMMRNADDWLAGRTDYTLNEPTLTSAQQKCLPISPRPASIADTSLLDTVVLASTANIQEVAVSLVVSTITGSSTVP